MMPEGLTAVHGRVADVASRPVVAHDQLLVPASLPPLDVATPHQ